MLIPAVPTDAVAATLEVVTEPLAVIDAEPRPDVDPLPTALIVAFAVTAACPLDAVTDWPPG